MYMLVEMLPLNISLVNHSAWRLLLFSVDENNMPYNNAISYNYNQLQLHGHWFDPPSKIRPTQSIGVQMFEYLTIKNPQT